MQFLALVLALSASAFGSPHKPTFVLVHGALFTSAGWMKVQSKLQNDGHNVVTLDVPGRAADGLHPKSITIQTAAQKVCRVVGLQNGPVILVGHSQGGAVITQALAGCASRIKALIYVAAVVPVNGEVAFAALDPKADVNFAKCADPDPDAGLFRLNRQGPLAQSFFQDLGTNEWPAAVASMVSEPMGIGTTPLNFPQAAFDRTPKYYIETLRDQILTLGTQRRIQSRVALRAVFPMDTGHSPFLSRPATVARILEGIVAGL